MLGLGTNLFKGSAGIKTIVTDNLVLKHDYMRGGIHQVSTGAAFFDGTDDKISLGTTVGTTGHKSFTAWIHHDGSRTISAGSGNEGAIFTFGDVMIELTTATEITSFHDVDNTPGDGPIPTALNNWRHIATTMEVSGSNTITKVYADGVHVETTTISGSVPTTDSRTGSIGSYSGNRFFPGYICNVGFWSGRVLTQAEIKSIWYKKYADLTAAEKTSLVSWWNLDSVIDSVNAATLVYDNHHGGGETFGSELIDNPTFSSDLSDWTLSSDTPPTYVDGNMQMNSDGATFSTARQSFTTVVGAIYILSGNIITFGSSNKIEIGTSAGGSQLLDYTTTGTGTFTQHFTATGTTTHINVEDGAGSTGNAYSEVSVKRINGNTGTLS